MSGVEGWGDNSNGKGPEFGFERMGIAKRSCKPRVTVRGDREFTVCHSHRIGELPGQEETLKS